MKTILLWDPRFPDRAPTRLTLHDDLASAAVRAGVAAAAEPADAGMLAAGAPVSAAEPIPVLVQHGAANRLASVFLPKAVAIVGAALGILTPKQGAGFAGGAAPDPVLGAFTILPTVSGSRSVGSVLTATTGLAGGASSYQGQWLREDQPIAGATATTYTLAVADAGKNISYRSTPANASGSGAAATTAPGLCGSISRKRVSGGYGSVNGGTVAQVMRAPAVFDAVRLILHVRQNTLPGGPVKVTLAPSARAGRNPTDAAGAAQAWTTVTWNGATSLTVANAANSADGGYVENDYISDIMPMASLDRVDVAGAPPMVHARCWATTFCPAAVQANGTPGAVEADYLGGTYSGDQTTAVAAADPINPTYHAALTWVFYHRGVKVSTIGFAADSTGQGSHNSLAATPPATDGTLGNYNGLHRQLGNLMAANGIVTSYEQMCLHGDSSPNFHERARNAVANLAATGLTHLMLYIVSVNDPSQTAATFAAAKARVNAIVGAAKAAGVNVIVVRNPAGYETTVGKANGYNEFFDSLAAAGTLIFDTRPPIGLAATGYPTMPDAYLLHDSTGARLTNGDAHPNDLYFSTEAAAMWADRARLKLTL